MGEVEIQGEDETSEVQKAVQDVKKEFKVQREDGKKDEKVNEHQMKELTTYGTPEVQKTVQDVKKEVEEGQKEVQREVRAVREAVHNAVQERKIQNVRGWRVQNGRRQQSHENEKNLENDEVKEHRKKEATTYETPEVQKTIQGAKKEVEVQREDETSEVQKAVHDVQKEVRKEHGKKDDKGNEHPMKELTTYGTPEVKKEKLQKEVQKEVQRKVRAVREVVHNASQREIQHVRGERVQDRTGQQTHEIQQGVQVRKQRIVKDTVQKVKGQHVREEGVQNRSVLPRHKVLQVHQGIKNTIKRNPPLFVVVEPVRTEIVVVEPVDRDTLEKYGEQMIEKAIAEYGKENNL